MALYAALRRTASSAAPLAIRSLSRSHHSHFSILTHPLSPRRSIGDRTALPLARSAFFSSVAKKPASDADLLGVIDIEIKCAEESDDHDRVEDIPDRFPFEIHDEKGMNIVTLKRNYQGETIEVVVSMPSLVTGEEPENNEAPDNDDEDGDQERPSQSSIPLTINISKGDGPTLEFSCTAYPDEVTIDSMSVRQNKESEDEMLAYEGPDFNDLDENLQKAFHKYLEIRGISPMTTNLLHEYMINKDSPPSRKAAGGSIKLDLQS